jgi:hypothetical protein
VKLIDTNVNDEWLQNLGMVQELTGLDMTGCEAVTDDGLAKIAGLTRLRSLSVAGSQVTDAGLRNLKDMTEITHLFLGNTQITDARLKHLGHMKKMEWLDLRSTRVTDEGLKHLACMSDLWQLVLRDTEVTVAPDTQPTTRSKVARNVRNTPIIQFLRFALQILDMEAPPVSSWHDRPCRFPAKTLNAWSRVSGHFHRIFLARLWLRDIGQ